MARGISFLVFLSFRIRYIFNFFSVNNEQRGEQLDFKTVHSYDAVRLLKNILFLAFQLQLFHSSAVTLQAEVCVVKYVFLILHKKCFLKIYCFKLVVLLLIEFFYSFCLH